MTHAKIPLFMAASALALGLVACGPSNPAAEAHNATEVAVDENSTVVTTEVDSGVINFVEKATLSNMFEIESAKLALERSKVQPDQGLRPRPSSTPIRHRRPNSPRLPRLLW